MKAISLQSSDATVRLVEPGVDRDARHSLDWINQGSGFQTLRSMGVADKDNNRTTIEIERQRIENFIVRDDQLNWMIESKGSVVGSAWVDLNQRGTVLAPALHIMIGDPQARGSGVGKLVVSTILKHLHEQGQQRLYSRCLVSNVVSMAMLNKLGFKALGESYIDENGLEWQNVVHDAATKE